MYYIFVKNDKIVGCGQCPCLEMNNVEVSEVIYNTYVEDNLMYVYQNGQIVPNPNYEEEKAQQEQNRINMLTMTAWDFVEFLKSCGLTSAQIMGFLNSNPDIQLHLTCCQNVYCGVAKSLMPITLGDITITPEMVEYAFRLKYGETS